MILSFSDKNERKIAIFEAEGGNGVGLCSWDKFMKNKWNLLYAKLVYRKLNVKKTKEMCEKLSEFV